MIYPRILQRFDDFLVATVDKYANFRWYNSPLTKKTLASPEKYLQIWNDAKQKKYEIVDNFEKNHNFKIDEDWYHKLALQTQVVIKKSEIVYVHGRLLYASLSEYLQKKEISNPTIIETGTARSFSALCMAKALNDAKKAGKILTFDVLPNNKKMYWNCIADHQGKKTRLELLENYRPLVDKYIVYLQGNTKIQLPKIQASRVHFAFLDSSHTYYNLMAEFLAIKNKQQKGDIIFFDDYTPKMFPGVVKAVNEICEKYNYSKKVIKISDARAYVVAEKL